jgi:immunoglobulin-binding protein 1
MTINHHLAELIQRIFTPDISFRKSNLLRARDHYDRFLKLLDSYDMLSTSDARLLEAYTEDKANFSTVSTRDAAARRDVKIARFRQEKELKRKLEYLQQNPQLAENDEQVVRDLNLTNLTFLTFQTFQSLESMAQELHIISLAPPAPPPGSDASVPDGRQDSRNKDGYSERLDGQVAGLRNSGPILSSDGKPMRPFTILDNRTQLRKGVFRPDHSLPTMTIDEYLEEEKRRGGMIEGGGPQSEVQAEPNEDDMDLADAETIKQRAWDEYVEANPKGSGNTLNRG